MDVDDQVKKCYRFIARLTLDRAFEDNDVAFFDAESEVFQAICGVAGFDVGTVISAAKKRFSEIGALPQFDERFKHLLHDPSDVIRKNKQGVKLVRNHECFGWTESIEDMSKVLGITPKSVISYVRSHHTVCGGFYLVWYGSKEFNHPIGVFKDGKCVALSSMIGVITTNTRLTLAEVEYLLTHPEGNGEYVLRYVKPSKKGKKGDKK